MPPLAGKIKAGLHCGWFGFSRVVLKADDAILKPFKFKRNVNSLLLIE